MQKGFLFLAVMGLLSFSTTAFAAGHTTPVTYTSEFLRFDGCPWCPDSCAHEDVINYLPYICGGIFYCKKCPPEYQNLSSHAEATFTSTKDGWDVKIQLFDGVAGVEYQVKSNHYFFGSNPTVTYDGKTGIITGTGKGTTATLSFHITTRAARVLDSTMCIFVDCDPIVIHDPITGNDVSCSHWNLMYARNYAY